MALLVKNIGTIVGIDRNCRERVCGAEMDCMERLDNAWLIADNGIIKGFGPMSVCPDSEGYEVIDAASGMLLPSYCDSHTHIVYAGSREQEFLDKIHGLSYEQIAQRGGGILNSADRLHATSEDELFRQAMERIDEIIAMGTGAVEIKSGYDISASISALESVLKCLVLILPHLNTNELAINLFPIFHHTYNILGEKVIIIMLD